MARKVLNGNFVIVQDKDSKKELAECVICGSRLKYHHSTTTLQYHLNKKHPFTKVSDESANHPKLKQTTLNLASVSVTPTHDHQITKKLCLWIAKDMRPISICEDVGLNELMKVATRDNTYKLPGRTSVKEKLHDLYNSLYPKMKEKVVNAKHITLAFDHWTSVTNDNYTGIILVYVNEGYELTHVTAGIFHSNDSQTAENIQQHVTSIMNDWGISSNVKYCCTDNAANMLKASKLLNLPHLPCMAHTLQLSINHAIDQTGLSTILAKARAIVGRIKRSPLQKGNLQKVMKDSNLSLIQDVPTRWGSTLDMITRLIIQREPVCEWLLTQSGLNTLNESEWKKLEVMRDLLQPCEQVCKLLGGESYVTASVVLPALALLKNKMTADDDDTAYARRFKEGLYADICTRMHKAENNATLQIATALDIRFKSLKSLPKSSREQVWCLLLRLVKDDESTSDDVSEPAPKKVCTKLDLFSIDSDDDEETDETVVDQEVKMYRSVIEVIKIKKN